MSGSTEIYNNLKLKAARPLDAKLGPVANKSLLLNPTVPQNFLYEGATVWVVNEDRPYVVKNISNVLTWVPASKSEKVLGSINLLTTATEINLLGCVPALENCWGVIINIQGTGTPLVSSISNLPTGEEFTFFVQNNKSVTFKHTNRQDASAGDIVLELGMDMNVKGRSVATERLILYNDSGINTQWGSVQFINLEELQELVGSALTISVVNNLTTQNSAVALSAQMGYELKQLIDAKNAKVLPGVGLSKTVNPSTGVETFNLNLNYYSKAGSATPVGNIDTYLTTRPNSDTHNQIIDLTPHNQGSYMLPRGAAANNINNWITIIQPATASANITLSSLYAVHEFTESDQVYLPVNREDVYDTNFITDMALLGKTGDRFNLSSGKQISIGTGSRKVRLFARLSLPFGENSSTNINTLGRKWVEPTHTIDKQIDLKYGYLYNSFAADVITSTTSAWRLPTLDELLFLGLNLKTAEATDWGGTNISTNIYNFSALPNGYRDATGVFTGKGSLGYWWTSTIVGATKAIARMLPGTNTVTSVTGLANTVGASIRLVKEVQSWEESIYEEGKIIPKAYLDPAGNYYNAVRIGSLLLLTTDLISDINTTTEENIAVVTNDVTWAAATTPALCSYDNNPLDTTFYNLEQEIFSKKGKVGFMLRNVVSVQSTQNESMRATEYVDENTKTLTITLAGVFNESELTAAISPLSFVVSYINTTDLPYYGGLVPLSAVGLNTLQVVGKFELRLEELL